MKLKVKVIREFGQLEVENRINEFLESKGTGWVTNLIDIKFQVYRGEDKAVYFAMIIYKEL